MSCLSVEVTLWLHAEVDYTVVDLLIQEELIKEYGEVGPSILLCLFFLHGWKALK